MSEAEKPSLRAKGDEVTVDDVRQLMGASTPHFALQVRNRIARLIADLPDDHPARVLGEREIARLTQLGFSGENRNPLEDLAPLASLSGRRGVGEVGAESGAPHPTPRQRDEAFPGSAGA